MIRSLKRLSLIALKLYCFQHDNTRSNCPQRWTLQPALPRKHRNQSQLLADQQYNGCQSGEVCCDNVFSREFKLQLLKPVISEEKRPAQICREHNLAESVLLRWRREVEQRGDAAFTDKPADETEALQVRIVELERFCGQLALENAVLEKALSAARSPTDTR